MNVLAIDVGGTRVNVLASNEHERIVAEPKNAGRGWVGFDFRGAFGAGPNQTRTKLVIEGKVT